MACYTKADWVVGGKAYTTGISRHRGGYDMVVAKVGREFVHLAHILHNGQQSDHTVKFRWETGFGEFGMAAYPSRAIYEEQSVAHKARRQIRDFLESSASISVESLRKAASALGMPDSHALGMTEGA